MNDRPLELTIYVACVMDWLRATPNRVHVDGVEVEISKMCKSIVVAVSAQKKLFLRYL